MANGVCVDIYRRPKNFSRLSDEKKLEATRQMERIKVRFFADNPTVLALACAVQEMGIDLRRVQEHGDE